MTARVPATPRSFVYAVVALIAYASLYPFRFQPQLLIEALQGPWLTHLLVARSGWVDRIANICFYVPLGYLLALRLRPLAGTRVAIVVGLLVGGSLSFLMEMLQFAVPTRTPCAVDIAMNVAGTLTGMALAMAVPGLSARLLRTDFWRSERRDPLLGWLLLGWITLKAAPFIPRLGIYRTWKSLESMRAGEFAFSSALNAFALWLLMLAALRALLAQSYYWRACLAFTVVSLLTQLLINHQHLTWSELAGCAAAWLVTVVLNSSHRNQALGKVFVIALLSIFVAGLAPFRFVSTPQPFQWLPFAGSLESEVAAAGFILLGKTLLYAACWWAGARSGHSRVATTAVLVAVVGMVEILQRFLVGRIPEITDIILVLLIGIAAVLLDGPEKKSAIGIRP